MVAHLDVGYEWVVKLVGVHVLKAGEAEGRLEIVNFKITSRMTARVSAT